MTQTITTAVPSAPFVTIRNNQAVTSSRNVARSFGKDHADVMNHIRHLEGRCRPNFITKNFQHSYFTTYRNRKYPMYLLTRDGLKILVERYVNDSAQKVKQAYADAFAEVEKKLKAEQKAAVEVQKVAQKKEPKAADQEQPELLQNPLNLTPEIVDQKEHHIEASVEEYLMRALKSLNCADSMSGFLDTWKPGRDSKVRRSLYLACRHNINAAAAIVRTMVAAEVNHMHVGAQ